MAKRTRTAAETFLDQHIALPGVPSVVMSRANAYTWFAQEVGMDTSAKGFGSLDHLVFGARAIAAPATEMTEDVRAFLSSVAVAMRQLNAA